MGNSLPLGSPFSSKRALKFLQSSFNGAQSALRYPLSTSGTTWSLGSLAEHVCGPSVKHPTLLDLCVCSSSLDTSLFPQHLLTVHASDRQPTDHQMWTKHVLEPSTVLGSYDKCSYKRNHGTFCPGTNKDLSSTSIGTCNESFKECERKITIWDSNSSPINGHLSCQGIAIKGYRSFSRLRGVWEVRPWIHVASGPVKSLPSPWFEESKRARTEGSLGAHVTQSLILQMALKAQRREVACLRS